MSLRDALRKSSSLLLFKSTMSGKPAVAFLKLLAALRKKAEEHTLLACYAEVFSELAAGGHASWQSYIADEVVGGKANVLAKAAARGELDGCQALLPAARCDLQALQLLASLDLLGLIESELSGSDAWLAAARLPVVGDGAGLAAAPSVNGVAAGREAGAWVGPPLAREQRQAWRARLAASQCWPDLLDELLGTWAAHGAGLVGTWATLQWSGGGLQGFSVQPARGTQDGPGLGWVERARSVGRNVGAKVLEARDGLERSSSTRLVICTTHPMDAPETKRAPDEDNLEAHDLVWGAMSQALIAEGVRLVRLPLGEVQSLDTLSLSLSQHSRVFFAVMLPVFGPEHYQPVWAALSGTGRGWPPNAVLVTFAPRMPDSCRVVDGWRHDASDEAEGDADPDVHRVSPDIHQSHVDSLAQRIFTDTSGHDSAAMYLESLDAFIQQAEELYNNDPLRVRYVLMYKHKEGKLLLKVTDDKVCLQYQTDQVADLKKVEKLNDRFFTLMARGEDAADVDMEVTPPPGEQPPAVEVVEKQPPVRQAAQRSTSQRGRNVRRAKR